MPYFLLNMTLKDPEAACAHLKHLTLYSKSVCFELSVMDPCCSRVGSRRYSSSTLSSSSRISAQLHCYKYRSSVDWKAISTPPQTTYTGCRSDYTVVLQNTDPGLYDSRGLRKLELCDIIKEKWSVTQSFLAFWQYVIYIWYLAICSLFVSLLLQLLYSEECSCNVFKYTFSSCFYCNFCY